jgi:lipid-A-disaccharide synthase
MSRTIFLSAGEASGDARGAELIRTLREKDPSLHFFGMGGPEMRAEGMEVLADLSNLAVVGIIEVLKHYGTFKRTMDQLLNQIQNRKPQAVIGIDYPGFNLRLLKQVRNQDRQIKLIQYVSPQLWAWDERRKWKMAEYLDMVLCIFPFEPDIYKETRLKAIFVGHPLVQSIHPPSKPRDPHLIAFFPGSREKEIRAHMPVFAEIESNFASSQPTLRFAYAASTPRNSELILSSHPKATIESASTLYNSANTGIICSGTATLEAALHELPIGVIYRVAWPTYWMGRFLIKVPFLAMPNILAERKLVKEFIQSEFNATQLSPEILRLHQDQNERTKILRGYQEIREKLGNKKAAENAAQEILSLLD